jgi:hypothetical protein
MPGQSALRGRLPAGTLDRGGVLVAQTTGSSGLKSSVRTAGSRGSYIQGCLKRSERRPSSTPTRTTSDGLSVQGPPPCRAEATLAATSARTKNLCLGVFGSPVKYELFADMGESEAFSVKRTWIVEGFPTVGTK